MTEDNKKRPALVARPHSKPVDYAAVRKDIMKRFRKVLAELGR